MPYPIECGCGASLNRTHVVIFTVPLDPLTKNSSCIGKLTLDVNLLSWINVDPCFIALDHMINTFHNTIHSSTFFDKSGKMYQTELSTCIHTIFLKDFSSTSRTIVVWFEGGNFHNGLYHIRSNEALKLDYTHEETHPQNTKSKAFFTLQGILFMISSDAISSNSFNLSISVFNQSSLSLGKKQQQLNSNVSRPFTKLMAIPLYV